jgi:hypothetical protein
MTVKKKKKTLKHSEQLIVIHEGRLAQSDPQVTGWLIQSLVYLDR